MTELVSSRPRAITFNVREQTERWVTPLNLHWAVIALLGLINLYLLIHMAVLWQTAKSQDAEAQARQRLALQTAQIAARPLAGVDAKLKTAETEADAFYSDRLPITYSEIATEYGALARRDNVRLTRVGYSQDPVLEVAAAPGGHLSEVKLDMSLQGDYRGLAQFINGFERDHMFFVITGVALTGQDSGRVNLRMRATTYLRGLSSNEEAVRASTPVSTSETLADQAIADQESGSKRKTGAASNGNSGGPQ